MNANVVVVEAVTSGAGLLPVDAAIRGGKKTTFVTSDVARFALSDKFECLEECNVIDGFDTRDPQQLGLLLSTFLEEGEPPAVICMNDRAIAAVARACQDVSIPFLPVLAVTIAQDKVRFRQLCESQGVAAPKSFPVHTSSEAESVAHSVGLPVVVKPSSGTGSVGVTACFDIREVPSAFRSASASSKTVQVETLAIGPLVSAELLVTNDHMYLLGLTDRVLTGMPSFVETGGSFPVKLSEDTVQSIEHSCGKIVDALNFRPGFAHVEFVLTSSGPVVIEFNPRLGGRNVGPMIEAALQWDLYSAVVELATNGFLENVPPVASQAASDYAVYAPSAGKYAGLTGISAAMSVEGLRQVRRMVEDAHPVSEDDRHRIELAVVLATGSSTDEAAARARTGASLLRPIMQR